MLEIKKSINMINNINYHLDYCRKNDQHIKSFSNKPNVTRGASLIKSEY